MTDIIANKITTSEIPPNLSINSIKSTSSASSKSSVNTNVKANGTKNFIEKNKQFVTTRKNLKLKNFKSNNSSNNDSDIVIRYLNEIIVPSKSSKINIAKEVEANKTGKNAPQEEQEVAVVDAEEENNVVDISIISNHSSIHNNSSIIDVVIKNPEREVNKPNLSVQIIDSESSNFLKQPFKNVHNRLVQGSQHDAANEPPQFLNNLTNHNDEVNILHFDHEKSKIRSQFIQKFGSIPAKRRQIIPNLIDSYEANNERNDGAPDSLDSNCQKTTARNESEFSSSVTNSGINMASLAAMNSIIAQPFVKMHNELENKITHVLKELEILRENDGIINSKLIMKSEPNKLRDQETKENETNARIKYLEKLQENQFQLMSQLINVFGTSKENKTKMEEKNYEVNEPVINQEPFIPTVRSEPFNLTTKNMIRNSRRNNVNTNGGNAKSHSLSQSRSRGRAQSMIDLSPKKKASKTRANSNYKSSSSRSRSNSRNRMGCDVCSTTNLNYSFSNDDMKKKEVDKESSKLKKKNGKFLEDLLSKSSPIKQQKSPTSSFTSLINKDNKSSIFAEENEPTLFDKYLIEAKQLNNLNEKLSQETNTIKKIQFDLGNEESSTKLANGDSKITNSKSAFSDLKEILKAIEISKSEIDLNLDELERERKKKMFYLFNAAENEENEKLKMIKLVNGCVNAIKNDVKKVVAQKLIDETKHAKLEAEKDTTNNKAKRIKSSTSLGFGSSASVRSQTNLANDQKKPTKNVSETRKYLGKVYGPAFLEQMKMEELAEKNRLAQEQKELDKLKRQKEQHKSRQTASKPVNKVVFKSKSPTILKIDPQRPAFLTQPFASYPESKLKTFVNTPGANATRPKSNENVGLITIIPNDAKPTIQLKKQDLPSLSINPSRSHIRQSNQENVTINESTHEQQASPSTSHTSPIPNVQDAKANEKHVDDDDDEEFDVNQKGTGIEIPGSHYKPSSILKNEEHRPNISDFLSQNDLSNETSEFVRARDVLETRAFDWLEQELMSRFITQLSTQLQSNQALNVDDDDQDSTLSENTDLKDKTDLMNIIGQKGFKIFVDVGEPIDQNLIELLAREVLEEKISSMVYNKQLYMDEQPSQQQQAPPSQPPQPSPRKSLEFLEHQKDQYDVDFEVETPIGTPPIQSPRRPAPSASVNPKPQQHQDQQQQLQIYLLEKSEDEYSILDVSIEENNQEEQNQNQYIQNEYSNSVVVPQTPNETPRPSPSPPPETPSASINEPPPPQPQSPKLFKSTSVQCDSPVQPKSPSPPPSQPPPVVETPRQPFSINVPHQNEPKLPESGKKRNKPDKLDTISTSSDLTESTQYTSSIDISTTLNSEEKTEDSDSYFSDGAWLMSKSEGQIIPIDQNAFVNLDLANAVKSVQSNPLKPKSKEEQNKYDLITRIKNKPLVQTYSQNGQGSQSEGEVKLGSLDKDLINMYGAKPKSTGINRIIRSSEAGEVQSSSIGLYGLSEMLNANNRSEGEAESQVDLIDKMNKKLASKLNEKAKKSQHQYQKKSGTSEKQVIDLKISNKSKSKPIKNKIRIESIPNEILVRDSNDFERKIYSSTPDTTMFANSGVNLGGSTSLKSTIVVNSLIEEEVDDKNDHVEVGELELTLGSEGDDDKTSLYLE